MTDAFGDVLVTTDAVGGVWRATFELARGLRRRGRKADLLCIGPAPDAARRKACMKAGIPLLELDAPLDWMAPDAESIANTRQALAQIARRYDLVHLSAPAFASADLPPTVGHLHSCLATWARAVGEAPAGLHWRSASLLEGLAHCARVAAPTRAYAQAFRNAHDVNREIAIVPNGIGRYAMPPPYPPHERTGVVCAGRFWDRAKNVGVLDEAAARSRRRISAFGAFSGPFGVAPATNHLEKRGHVSGSTLLRAFAQARVFASAALYEPFGLCALEAARMSCALVLSDIPTHREIWGDSAVFAPPNDPHAFAAALTMLSNDDGAWSHYADAASRRARTFSVSRMIDAVCNVYRSFGAPVRSLP